MRVSIWRRLRKLGAVYLDEGVWVLPNNDQLASEVKGILRDIGNFHGTASAFISLDFDESQGERIKSRSLAARDEEYAELEGQCRRFMLHVEHATLTERYTFAEVEELEEEITKLERWLSEIQSRDLFGSPQALVCAKEIERGRNALAQFTERAFALSSDGKDAALLHDPGSAPI